VNSLIKILLGALLTDILVCTAIVNGLNNFQVGFLTALPTSNTAIDMNSYTVCGSVNTGVNVGLVITITCTISGQYQYIIVQSKDTSAEKLCLAEVCVLEPGQYAVTFIVILLIT